MLKQSHPDWGCQRISDMLLRGPALPASPAAVARVLHEAGYEMEEPCRPVRTRTRCAASSGRKPNQLWQTDLFTFMLKRQNRRVYLVAFMDDHSRFIVGYGLHASQSTALVLEVLRAAIAAYGAAGGDPDRQRHAVRTWRGKSQFSKELEKRGIKQIVAAPRASADAGQDRALLGNAVAGVPGGGGVPRPGRRPAADRPVHRPLQLPASAPGDRRAGAGGPVLRGGAGGAADPARAGGRQRAGAGPARLPRQSFYLTGQVGDRAVQRARGVGQGRLDEVGRDARGGGSLASGRRAAPLTPAASADPGVLVPEDSPREGGDELAAQVGVPQTALPDEDDPASGGER